MTLNPQLGAAYVPPAVVGNLGVVIENNAAATASSVQACINMKNAGLRTKIQPYQIVQAGEGLTQFFLQQAQVMAMVQQPNGLAAMTGAPIQPPHSPPGPPPVEASVEDRLSKLEAAITSKDGIMSRILAKVS